MTTQTISVNRRDGQHDTPGMAVPYAPQPGSPTLTNPDMILPDYDDPETDNERTQLPLSIWNSGHSIADGFQFSQNGFYVNPNPLTTPIIYGNGTMLSDIGEVTEVESNAGRVLSRNTSRRSNRSTDEDTPLRSSPTMGKKIVDKRQQYIRHERRLSTESTSTINTHNGGAFLDFDDSASVGGDSNFQGDDEESLASSYVDDNPVSRRHHVSQPSAPRLGDDNASMISISRRAEKILANAKLRLTHMEDNLTRARTLSYSSVSDGSTPSPPISGPSPSLRGPTVYSTSSNHSRNMSEKGVAGTSKLSGYPQRSASALGAAGGYRRPLPTSRSVDGLGSASGRGAHSHYIDTSLEPLSEDDDTFGTGSTRRGPRSAGLASPTFGTYSDGGLTRSASVMQVRDLQDQMKGLKGKISSLREQARADSMKRRSLQSLRTPSPFTHATWDQGVNEPRAIYSSDEHSPALTEKTNAHTPGSGDDNVPEKMEDKPEVAEESDNTEIDDKELETHESQEEAYQDDTLESREPSDSNNEVTQDVFDDTLDDSRREDGDGYDTEDNEENQGAILDGHESESGESLYHESFQHQLSHEDREDAFDYEHFFLHSAMSTLAGQRSRSESVSSDDSVETTRGPIMPRQRRGSVDTATSADSFETAAEGPSSRSSTSQGGHRVYTPADLFEDTRDENENENESESGSDGTAFKDNRRRTNSVIHRPLSTSSVASTLHRPSYSSFESTGTNRSFPLVNKTKLNGGILTPGGSPDHGLKQVTDSLMNDAASICENDPNDRGGQSPAMQILSKEDQLSVERLVASLGKCVLALGEPDGAHTGGHDLCRRRIEAALRILEGETELP